MKRNTQYFFHYTTAAITVLVIGSIFFLPQPFSLIIPVALLPSFLFFWIKITDPMGATDSQWSARMAIVILSLAGLGILGFWLQGTTNKQLDEARTEILALTEFNSEEELKEASVSGEIAAIRAELEKIKKESEGTATNSGVTSDQISDLLNSLTEDNAEDDLETLPTLNPLGNVQVVTNSEVNVFEERSINSRILGIATSNRNYAYFENKDGWYLVEFTSGQVGWVKDTDVVVVKGNLN